MKGLDDLAQPTRLLTPRQACILLGVTRRTLARYEEKGMIRAHRTLGGHRRFDEMEVARLRIAVETKMRPTQQPKPPRTPDEDVPTFT